MRHLKRQFYSTNRVDGTNFCVCRSDSSITPSSCGASVSESSAPYRFELSSAIRSSADETVSRQDAGW